MAGSLEKITPGYPKTWTFGPRTFGGRGVTIGTISDVDGSWNFNSAANFTGEVNFTETPMVGDAAVLTSPLAPGGLPAGIITTSQVTGLAAPGSIVLAGAKVGDVVQSVIDMTAAPAVLDNSGFETTISVDGHIQQTTATDLHTHTAIMVTLIHQS